MAETPAHATASLLKPFLGIAALAIPAIDLLQTLDARACDLAKRNALRIAHAQNDTLFAIRHTIDDFVTRLARAAETARTRQAA